MQSSASNHPATPRVLYCRCAYARIVPNEVKDAVLDALASSGMDFEAVPDLCEMSARKDPHLQEIAQQGPVKIVACFPRAVRWLFSAAGASLNKDQVQILNMREAPAADIVREILPATEAAA